MNKLQSPMEGVQQASNGVSASTNENGTGKPFWKSFGGVKKKRRKKTPAEKNQKLKKHVQPKNAVMCLYELVPNAVFTAEHDAAAVTAPSPLCYSVEINGQKFRGVGTSKQMAKHSAAEAALVSFVKPPTVTTEESAIEDTTPWSVLAPFAMYKLFSDWREGKIGQTGMPVNPFSTPMVQDVTLSQTLQTMLNQTLAAQNIAVPSMGMGGGLTMATNVGDTSNTLNSYLVKGGNSVKNTTVANVSEDMKNIPSPAKQIPANANDLHPVMLLHQMRPVLSYIQNTITKGTDKVCQLTCVIDNMKFIGEGPNMKKAKFNLALKANKSIFGVVSNYKPLKD